MTRRYPVAHLLPVSLLFLSGHLLASQSLLFFVRGTSSNSGHWRISATLTMRSALLSAVAGLAVVVSAAFELPPNVPRNIQEFRQKHPYQSKGRHGGGGHGSGGHGGGHWSSNDTRPIVTIRASCNDADDVSDEFEAALREANNGGTLYLKEGETYVIGKPLNLTFLNDVHVNLEGEIKFTDDTEYWQVCIICPMAGRGRGNGT